MDTALYQGDLARNAGGFPYLIQGMEELLQQAFIRLTVPKGAFCYDTGLGSLLHTLDASSSTRDAQAAELAAQALAGLEVTVTGAACTDTEEGLSVAVGLDTAWGSGEVTVIKEARDGSNGNV